MIPVTPRLFLESLANRGLSEFGENACFSYINDRIYASFVDGMFAPSNWGSYDVLRDIFF